MTAKINLHGYIPLGELADMSPFVTKVENTLRLADIPFDKQPGNLRTVPRGKLPYAELDGRGIPDSTAILAALSEAGVLSLDDHLDPDQRAELSALRALLEFELYFSIAYFRWQEDAGWSRYRPFVIDFLGETGIPVFLAKGIVGLPRRQFVSALHAQGVGRRPAAEVLERARELFGTLEHFLIPRAEQGPWWFGAQPSSADALVHAFVGGAVLPKLDTPLEGLIADYPALARHLDHVHGALRS